MGNVVGLEDVLQSLGCRWEQFGVAFIAIVEAIWVALVSAVATMLVVRWEDIHHAKSLSTGVYFFVVLGAVRYGLGKVSGESTHSQKHAHAHLIQTFVVLALAIFYVQYVYLGRGGELVGIRIASKGTDRGISTAKVSKCC